MVTVDLSIDTLGKRLDEFLYELGGLHYRYGSGLSAELPLGALYQRFGELSRPETFLSLRELVQDERTDPRLRTRLALWLEFLAGQVEDAQVAPELEEIAAFEARAQLPAAEGPLPFREAIALLSRETERTRRAAMETGLGQILWENQTPYARRLEAAARTAQALGFQSYLQLRDAVTGYSAQELATSCETVLAETRDAFEDLLSYVLKKLEPGLKAAQARRHDLQYASTAPWMAAHFPKGELLSSVSRCLSEMGLHPNAEGRIQLDTDDRPGKSARAFVTDLRVPDDIRLVVRPKGGLGDYFSLLHEYGHALQRAHVSRTAPVEERRLGDATVTDAYANLFDHLLLDEAWHRRFLRLPQATARESARIAAFNNLYLLRRYAAKLPYELSLYSRGPSPALAQEYEERLQAALLVGVPRGFFLYDVDPQLYATRYLRAWALEARLHEVLTSRFNEDFWRNPATGRYLKELFSAGQRDSAETLAQRLGAPLSLSEAGRRLVSVMAA